MVTWLLWSKLSPINRLVLVGSSVWVGDILIIKKPRDPKFNPPHLFMCRLTVQLLLSNSWAYGFCFLQKVLSELFLCKRICHEYTNWCSNTWEWTKVCSSGATASRCELTWMVLGESSFRTLFACVSWAGNFHTLKRKQNISWSRRTAAKPWQFSRCERMSQQQSCHRGFDGCMAFAWTWRSTESGFLWDLSILA